MRIDTPWKRAAFWFCLILIVLLAVKGLIVVSQFIGYATVTGAKGGSITELVIRHGLPTEYWSAVFGIGVRVEGYNNPQYDDFFAQDTKEKNLLFDCMEKDIEHEIYATTGDPQTMNLEMLYPMTAADLDAYLGRDPDDFDSATHTFTEPVSFDYGLTTITAPGTITYAISEDPPVSFQMAITKNTDDIPVFVAIVSNFTKGFNNRTFNFQLLLPAFMNSSTHYNFFTDPNDVCVAGEGEATPEGWVYGHVTSTTGSPIENVIVVAGGSAAVTDAAGFYNMSVPQGNHFIFAIKTGYRVYQNNVTVTVYEGTRHDITLEEEYEPNPFTGVGPGTDNPGNTFNPPVTQQASGGEGQAAATPVIQEPKVIEGSDYIVSVNEINRKLRLGQFIQERITIYSFKKAPASVSLRVNGTEIGNLIKTDKESLMIDPDSKDAFILTIFGVGETGTFNGTIELEGDLNASIPVTIEVLPKEQLPIQAMQIDVETAEKSYLPRQMVRTKTDIKNMLVDQQYPVHLLFTVQSSEGNETVWSYETNVFLKTAFSLIKSFELPSDVKPGDYILRVSASYLGFSSSSSTIFHVNVPFWARSFLGLRYWVWFLILFLIGAVVGAYYYIRRQIEARKKYHLKVDYDELPKPGPRSVYVGKVAETDHPTYFNLENFKTHTIVAGSTGGGKSVSAQVIVEEALDKGIAVIAIDPTAQWTGMLRPCKDKMMLSLYPLFGMKKTDAKAFPGNIRMILNAREKIDIKKYVKPGEIQVFCGHKLDPKDMDIMVANAIREIFHANFPENKLLKVMFVFDEVHRLLPKFGGSGDGFLQIERGCREFRKWGIGIMLVSQTLSDFMGTIKANINTEIQMRTRDEGDLERIRQKYGEDVLRSLVKATVGTGMVENPAYNRGQPYFVAFKPLKHSVERLSDEEIEQYNEYNDKIDNLFYSLEQLEAEKIDVFDLKLELKLALDKVKSGNFNMVKIYLEGVQPRIDKHWMKLGKEPKKLVRELVDMASIQEELKKAKSERDKYTAQQDAAKEAESDAGKKKEWGWKDDVAPDQILNLKNGMIVINLASLYDEVSAMKDADLLNEFLPEPPAPAEGEKAKEPFNNFATWVATAIGDVKLANALAVAKTKEELLKVLDQKKNGEEIPETKPPAWFKPAAAPPAQPAQPAAVEASALAPTVASGHKATPTPPAKQTSASAQLAAQPVQPIVESAQPSATPPPTQAVAQEASQPVQQEAPLQQSPAQVPLPSASEAPQQPQGGQVSVAKSSSSLDSLVVDDERKAFRLENGLAIKGIKELRDYLPRMDEATFKNHVSQEYNHFADWIKGVFNDESLAGKVRGAHTKEELIVALS